MNNQYDEQCFGMASDCKCPNCRNWHARVAATRKDKGTHQGGAVFSVGELKRMTRPDLVSALAGLEASSLGTLAGNMGLAKGGRRVEIAQRMIDHLFPKQESLV